MHKVIGGVILGTFALLVGACDSDYPNDYKFSGMIEEELIVFEKGRMIMDPTEKKCTLKVFKEMDRVITYNDYGCDREVDNVFVEKMKEYEFYSRLHGKFDEDVVKKAEKQFDEYLKKIKQAKIDRASDLLEIRFDDNAKKQQRPLNPFLNINPKSLR